MAGPKSTTVTASEVLVLNCTGQNIEGAPNPLSFRWVRNGGILMADGRISIVSKLTTNLTIINQLVIDPVGVDDAGMYQCIVTNREFYVDGVQSDSVTVTVIAPCKLCVVVWRVVLTTYPL